MAYQTQIAATKPDGWIVVNAATPQDAAIEALRRVGVKSVAWPCTVYVGDRRYKHSNGAPVVVHAFMLELTHKEERLTDDEIMQREQYQQETEHPLDRAEREHNEDLSAGIEPEGGGYGS